MNFDEFCISKFFSLLFNFRPNNHVTPADPSSHKFTAAHWMKIAGLEQQNYARFENVSFFDGSLRSTSSNDIIISHYVKKKTKKNRKRSPI
jgi:hypothetical protein